jgi:predicted nucleic acid-binding protein
MGALIDSSVLIAAERGSLDLESVLQDYAEVDFGLSAITASELLQGVHRAGTEVQRVRREAYVETLLSNFPIIAFDLICARAHARLSVKLAIQGINIGAHDLIIASTAIARGMDVVTRDERSFPQIPGIGVIRW